MSQILDPRLSKPTTLQTSNGYSENHFLALENTSHTNDVSSLCVYVVTFKAASLITNLTFHFRTRTPSRFAHEDWTHAHQLLTCALFPLMKLYNVQSCDFLQETLVI